jgi:hypothetical protein
MVHMQISTGPSKSYFLALISVNTAYTKEWCAFKSKEKNVFLTLHVHNIHCQQQKLSKFLMHYQQFISYDYCGAVGPVSKMTSKQKAVCSILRCPDL